MGNVTNRQTNTILFTIPLANSTPLQRVVETVTNACHLTLKKVALWLCDPFSARKKHLLRERRLQRLHRPHRNPKQKLRLKLKPRPNQQRRFPAQCFSSRRLSKQKKHLMPINHLDKQRGGDFGQQPSVRDITGVITPDDAGTKPISCLLSLPTALATKGRRILAPVKFATVFQVRHYKTTLPCTEFVDHKWYHQDRCDRPLNKNQISY